MNLQDINQLHTDFVQALAGNLSEEDLKSLQTQYLGRKSGLVTSLLSQLPSLPDSDKKQFGPKLQQLRQFIESSITERLATLADSQSAPVDWSLPAASAPIGNLHPITAVQQELEDIFRELGFVIASSPEIETDWFNFTALNMPANHPARDMQDTFYIQDQHQGQPLVLRTHTSGGQIRFMQEHKPPFAMVQPGRVFRNEATDITHEHTFQQMEGLVVAEDITFAQMMHTISLALQKFFGPDTKTKFVPSYFPFVEPGAEAAISNPRFKNGAWVEILGCGMVHQKVFTAAGYPAGKYQGFAFGFGLSRFALMKYGIKDIRHLAENDLTFIKTYHA